MNREILYRGKRMDNGEWAYGCYVNCSGPGCQPNETRHYIVEYPSVWHEFYTATRGQYTGLTDNNGNRIFEGDIVDVVRSGDETWRCVVSDIRNIPAEMCGSHVKSMEVIGNIHDNPEMLRGE